MKKRSDKEYPIGIPLCENNTVSPFLSRKNIEYLKNEAERAGYSLRKYLSIILKKYAIQDLQRANL